MAQTILHIDSSPLGERSASRKLTSELVAGLQARHPDSRVIRRDLASEPLPHLDGITIGAFFTPADQRNEALQGAISLSDQAVDEVLGADTIVIGVPMWNFGIPSSLKAWIDHIVRAGRTFAYGASGPEGLVPTGKKVFIVSARGAIYSEGPMRAMDFQEHYLKAILGFVGLTDVSVIRSEGAALGEEAAAEAARSAEAQLAAALASNA